MDIKAKKQTLRLIPYGLYVLTAHGGDGALEFGGATVSWLSQASFEPPRIVVGLRRDSTIWQTVQAAGSFVVNLLGSGQKDLASRFFRHVQADEKTLGGCPYHTGLVGAPILDDVPAYLECRVAQTIDAGDHTLFLADIVEAGVQHEMPALTMAETTWHYGG